MGRKDKKPAFFGRVFVEIYQQVLEVFKSNPTIVLLFFVLALIDLAALLALFLSHSSPFSAVLGPVIRRFFGEQYLHYPANFELLPKIYGYAHLVIVTVIGILITGIVVKKIEAYYGQQGKNPSSVEVLGPVIRKYLLLVIVFLVTYFIGAFIVKLLMPLVPKTLVTQFIALFILGLFVQALFAFLIPAILIADEGFFKSLVQGFLLGIRKLPFTMGLISLPILVMIVLSFFKSLAPVFVRGDFPDIVLVILIAGVFVSMIVDMLITSATTILYLKARSES